MLDQNTWLYLSDIFNEGSRPADELRNLRVAAVRALLGMKQESDDLIAVIPDSPQKQILLSQIIYRGFLPLQVTRSDGVTVFRRRPPMGTREINWNHNGLFNRGLCDIVLGGHNHDNTTWQAANAYMQALINQFILNNPAEARRFADLGPTVIPNSHPNNHGWIQSKHSEILSILQSGNTGIAAPDPLPQTTSLTGEAADWLDQVYAFSPVSNVRRTRRMDRGLRLMLESAKAAVAGDKARSDAWWAWLEKYETPTWKDVWSCARPTGGDAAQAESDMHPDLDLYDYLMGLREMTKWIRENSDLPDKVRLPRSLYNINEFVTRIGPEAGAVTVGPDGPEAVLYEAMEVDMPEADVQFLERIKDPDYIAKRKPEIDRVRQEIQQGIIKAKDAPALKRQAEAAMADLETTEQRENAKTAAIQRQIQEARVKLLKVEEQAASEAQSAMSLGMLVYNPIHPGHDPILRRSGNIVYEANPYRRKPIALGGFLDDAFKRITKEALRFTGSIARGFKDVAEEVKSGIGKVTPSELDDFARSIRDEFKRVERRASRETFRFSKRLVKVAPFIKAIAPVLGLLDFLLFGLGSALSLMIIAATSAVEVYYAYQMKSQLEKASKRAQRALMVELQALNAKIARIEALNARLEAKRRELEALSAKLMRQRQNITAEFQAVNYDPYFLYKVGALGLAGAAPFAFNRKFTLTKGAWLAAVATAGIYLVNQEPELPPQFQTYIDCLEFAPEPLCKQQYMQKRLEPLQDQYAALERLKLEYAAIVNELSGAVNEPA